MTSSTSDNDILDNKKYFTIYEIQVDKLFNRFNYKIPIIRKSRVTIIFGPNGTGKTTILKMLDSLAKKDLNSLSDIPFEELRIKFKEGTLKCSCSDNRILYSFHGSKSFGNKLDFESRGVSLESKETRALADFIEREGRKYGLGQNSWIQFMDYYMETSREPKAWWESNFERLDLLWKILAKMPEQAPVPPTLRRFFKVLDKLPFRLIPSQRLLEDQPWKERELKRTRSRSEKEQEIQKLKVQSCAEHLKGKISEAKDRFGELSQKLDRSFIDQLIERRRRGSENPPTDKEIVEKARIVEDKYQKLVASGLLEGSESPRYGPDELSDEVGDPVIRTALDVHFQNLEEKLREFDEVLEKVELLVQVINDNYSYLGKEIKADLKEGLVIVMDSGSNLPLNKLSSGEQHILVLIYDLIFKSGSGRVVLIDEPELSLHPSWQFGIVPNLQRIGAKSNLQFILATHSPQIINNEYEIAVPLEVSEG